MKLKLAIVDDDIVFVQQLSSTFQSSLHDKVELYTFTTAGMLHAFIKNHSIDVLLCSEKMNVDRALLPSSCAFGYLLETNQVETVNEQFAICKFQKPERIYKQILSLYSDQATDGYRFRTNSVSNVEIICFSGILGGVGCSTIAAAFGYQQSARGKKVLYLNLDPMAVVSPLFKGDDLQGLSEVIFSIKSNMKQATMRVESCISTDHSGVDFLSECKLALDFSEVNENEIKGLFSSLQSLSYDYIIVDMPFRLDETAIAVMEICSQIIFVTNGSMLAGAKLTRMLETLQVIEQQQGLEITKLAGILLNKASTTFGALHHSHLNCHGETPEFSRTPMRQLAEHIARTTNFTNIKGTS